MWVNAPRRKKRELMILLRMLVLDLMGEKERWMVIWLKTNWLWLIYLRLPDDYFPSQDKLAPIIGYLFSSVDSN
jgi:hypothetical protein